MTGKDPVQIRYTLEKNMPLIPMNAALADAFVKHRSECCRFALSRGGGVVSARADDASRALAIALAALEAVTL